MRVNAVASFILLLACAACLAQTRDEQVRSDKQKLEDNEAWVYNNLEGAIVAARAEKKPLLIVYRCIP